MKDISGMVSRIVHQSVADDEKYIFRNPLVGFAAADDPLFLELPKLIGSHHFLPSEVLAGVKTVISFFLPFSKETVMRNKKEEPVSSDWALAYLAANALIKQISEQMIEALRNQGFQSASIPATHTFDPQTLEAGWSHRSAAYIAGLGRFGLNRMLIGPSGCAGRYGTVFTTVEIEPTPIQVEDFCISNQNGRCGLCLKACPVAALSRDGFDKHKCYARLLANSDYLNLDGRLCDVCGKCVVACPWALKAPVGGDVGAGSAKAFGDSRGSAELDSLKNGC